MANPLRQDILTNLQTVLEGIDGTGNYNNTVTTVELAGRDWTDPENRPDLRPAIGIMPLEERWSDYPGHAEVAWDVLLRAVLTPSARTVAANAAACAGITSDIRQALYGSPNLGLNGVILAAMTKRVGSEGDPQAAADQIAVVDHICTITFIEDYDAQ
jgi:hypothetical protein